jgi:23S rRNA pseudouridine1911/1915/1917 synthase
MSGSLRLDQYLAKEYPEYSRSTWQKYIDGKYVTVNGAIEDSNKYVVSENDDVKFSLPEKQDFSERTLPIIYEDDNVIVIDKPVGVLTHAKGALNDELTVAEFVRPKTSYKSDTNRPGIIHRLDRDTSGVIICVKNDETAHLLNKQFQDRRAKKTYYAVVKGEPAHQRADIDLPIARNPKKPSTFRVDSSGKSAFTSYEVIQTKKNLSLLKLQPVTGRTHQLRVHMAYVNTPIYGDRVYGKEADRLYLHAASLEITIPEGDRRTFESKLPSSFLELTS